MTAAASDDLFVTLQVRPDIKPATLRRLAGLLETESHRVEEDTWSYQILREQYGSSHFKLRDLFAAYNEGATQLEEGDTVTLPPAPEWAFNVELTVPEAMT